MVQKQNKPPTPAPSEIDGRFQLLLILLSLLKSARHKAKKTELEFLMVNQTFNMAPYRHCVYWEWDGETVSIKAMSGLVQLDPHGPYTLWLKKVLEGLLKKKFPDKTAAAPDEKESFTVIFPVTQGDCAGLDDGEWTKWTSAHALLLAMKDTHGKVFGGMWIDREQAFNDLERAIFEDLGDGYAHELQRFEKDPSQRKKSFWRRVFSLSGSNIRIVMLLTLIVMLIPVRMSATAPAEIVARTPDIVSVPFNGVIEKIEVLPGQEVKKGDVLVRMEGTLLRNKAEMALGDVQAAEIALRKTERESLADRSKLADIAILKAQLEQKSAELKFAQEMLGKSEIKAERDGIVIFSDPNALRGKPAQTGQEVMLLADPKDSELLIRVPVESMILINEEIPAKFFLNVMPLSFKQATYESIGYQATPDGDGLMTYKVRARFIDDGDMPRIGWTGTGKVYGDKTLLFFNILRRPLVSLRAKLGI